MTVFSRRRFLEASALLAATAPLAGCIRPSGSMPNDAVAMADAVRSGKTTASALVEAAIARLERANPQINAVAYPNYDKARKAAAAGVTGPLGGVPTLIKDITPEAGLPYTSGSRAFAKRVPTETSPYLLALERSGAISIGRSTTPEFGLTATTEPLLTGATRNPWHLGHSAGGSSGGSGAAVAAGVVPVAHATDGGGSIRIPASVNGLVGLKPSRGRMAGSGPDQVTNVSVANCVSRTVRDTAAWFAATEATGEGARFAPVGVVTGASSRRLKIGLNLKRGDGSLPHGDVQNVFSNASLLLQRLGHRVSDQSLPFDTNKSTTAFTTLWGAGAARDIQAVAKALGRMPGPDDLEPLTFGMAEVARKAGEQGVQQAIATLTEVARSYNAQFETIDIYMTPVLALPPVPIGFLSTSDPFEQQQERLNSYVAYTPVENVAGAPSIALPMGQSRDGLPIGIQFATKPGGERVLLELAFELERELEWYRNKPPLWVGE
ncbi:amidase [Sphingoaurantiacus capsulatus]|uniref:Amidase n=1 Tax=Sphingoaurantiacus capsulatus TaxID=1771310 RepID=A0ABV7X729_9SPHN